MKGKYGVKIKTILILLGMTMLYIACSAGEKEGTLEETSGKEELTIYTLKDDPNLWQSVVSFEKAHPDCEIRIEVGLSEEDAVTRADAIRSLNTELMAGKGPDIVFLDGLPIENYIQKGVLEELGDVVNALEKEGEVLFENVAHAYERDGEVYALPTFFSVPIVVGEKSKVEGEDVDIILKKDEKISDEIAGYLAANAQTSVPVILLAYWDQIFPESRVDSELLKTFLESTKTVMEGSEIDLSLPYYKELSPFEGMIDIYPSYSGNVCDISFGKTAMLVETLNTTQESVTIQSLNMKTPVFYQYLNQERGKKFIPQEILGVNAAAEHKKVAKEFVEYFLSEQNMDRDCYEGWLSANKTWLEKAVPQSEDKAYMTTYYADQEMTSGLEIYELNKKETEEFLGFLDQAEIPLNIDQFMLETVLLETKKYVYEGASLDSTVNAIMEKIEIYRAE